MRSLPVFAGALALALALAAAVPLRARACGGFFCDGPSPSFPNAPPLVQTGENVFFAVGRDAQDGHGTVEAHIQIFYAGSPTKFSWVIPIEAQPTLDVGSNELFSALDGVTVPQFRVAWADGGRCASGTWPTVAFNPYVEGPSYPPPSYCRRGLSGAGGSGGSGSGGSGGGAPVDVTFRGDVGPYDAAVIRSDDPMALRTWLADNGYFVSPEAARIVDTYVGEGKLFVALKLIGGKGTGEIQPIVLRFPADGPCLPLRLTAISSSPSLKVNLWIAGPARAVPTNYLEVVPAELRLDWTGGGSAAAASWDDLVAGAVAEAGGRAFAVAYAGSEAVMAKRLWSPDRFDAARLRAATTPPEFADELAAQRFAVDGTMLTLLRKYIPLPDELAALGVTESRFYATLDCYWLTDQALFKPFDAGGFADELAASVIEPRRRAQSVLDGQPYLTRLVTFIAPENMTEDPLFTFNRDLPDVVSQRTAHAWIECGPTQTDRCAADVQLFTPEGWVERLTPLRFNTCRSRGEPPSYDRADLAILPALAQAWRRHASGEGTLVIDKRAALMAGLASHAARAGTGAPRLGGAAGCGCVLGAPRPTARSGAALVALAVLVLARRRKSSRARPAGSMRRAGPR